MIEELNQILELNARIATAEDEVFFEQLFCSTREFFHELQLPPEFILSVLKQQYNLQQHCYKAEAPAAVTYWLGVAGQAAGKLLLNTTDSELLIMDLVFVKTLRGKGFGSAVLNAVKRHAAKDGLKVRLSVDRNNNGARQLYTRHGFVVTASSESHDFMLWCA